MWSVAWRQYDGAAAAEALQQLVQLGYVAPPGEDARQAVSKTIAENRYNLARALLDAGMPFEAAEIIEALIAQDPTRMGYVGVKTCVAHIKGEKVEPVIDTGVKLITLESLNDPEIRKFLGLE